LTFSECFTFVDPTPYRQGCEDAISDAQTPEQKTSAICDAAAAYVSKCRDTTFLQPNVPTTCGKHFMNFNSCLDFYYLLEDIFLKNLLLSFYIKTAIFVVKKARRKHKFTQKLPDYHLSPA